MVKISMSMSVAFEGMKEVIDTLVIDHINTKYDTEKAEPCIIIITYLQARSIIRAYNNATQFVEIYLSKQLRLTIYFRISSKPTNSSMEHIQMVDNPTNLCCDFLFFFWDTFAQYVE